MDLAAATDAELLVATARDARAFGEFYDRYEEAILVFMLRRTASPEIAADLTAETFAAALVSARRYRCTGAPASAWLFAIADRTLIASYRKQRVIERARRKLHIPRLTIEDDTAERLERLSQVGLGNDAMARLAQLPDDQRSAIEARVLAERDVSEIAADLSCSPNVVRQRVSRGLATLRAQMEPPR